MKVLLVAHQYWPTPGSASQVLGSLVEVLRARAHEVSVVTSSPPAHIAKAPVGPRGERILYAAGAEDVVTPARRMWLVAEFALGVLRAGRREAFDIVVSDPPPTAAGAAAELARRRKVPFVYYLSDSWAGVARDSRSSVVRRAAPILAAAENRALRSACSVVAVTGTMRDIAEAAGARHVLLVENGVPLEVFTPAGEQWWPGASRRPFFLYAGNAGAVHGAEVFASAAEGLWADGLDFDLVYMGYGSDIGKIAEVARRHSDRLHVRGVQAQDVVAAATRTALGALSSIRPVKAYSDARPIKTLTGLASGTPAVFAGAGAFADLVAGHDVGFVSAWDVDSARASMRSLLELAYERPDDLARMRERSVEFARQHADDRAGASRVAALLEESVERAGGDSR